MKQYVTLDKRSKKAQREYYAKLSLIHISEPTRR